MAIEINKNEIKRVQHSGANTFLLANCSNYLQQTIEIEFDFDFASSTDETVIINTVDSVKILSGDWGGLGFVVGDSVALTYGVVIDNTSYIESGQSATIAMIQGDTMFFTTNVFDGDIIGVLLPQQQTSTSMLIVNTSRSQPEEIVFFHNLILNDANYSNASLIDGEVNKFIIEGVDSLSVSDTATVLQDGKQSGGRYCLDDFTFERLADAGTNVVYELKLFYFLPSYETNTFDEPSWFEVQQCLKDTFLIQGFPQTNNPNSQLEGQSFNQLANTGWFNENYNGAVNDFTIDNVSITDTSGQPLSEIDPNQTNVVSVTISAASSFLDIIEGVFEILPPESDFKNNQYSNLENSFLSYFKEDGGTSTFKKFGKNSGEVTIQSVTSTIGSSLILSFEIDPNAAFSTYIDSLNPTDRRYRISLAVETDGGNKNDNNAVTLILKEGVLEAAPIPDQPFDGVKSQGFYNHAQDIATGTSSVNYEGYTEDDMVFKAVVDLEDNVEWERVTLDVEVVKDSDGTSFDLFSSAFNIDGNPNAPIVNGVIQFDFEQQLNQFLDAPERNKISLKNTGNTGTGTYEVQLVWSMMANWRYWIANNSAFQEFFDNTLPNNGKNAEWVRYLDLAGYTLRARVRFIKDGVANFFGGNIDVKDYDDSTIATTITYFDEQGNQVGSLIDGQEMKIRADHVLSSGAWTLADTWGWLVQRGFEQDPSKRLSTKWDWSSQDSPLKPKSGETTSTLEIVTTNTTDDTARVECLIDTSLVAIDNFSVVARIQSPSEPTCQHPIDFIFDYIEANMTKDSDILPIYNNLLNQVILEGNVCCPTCSEEYGSTMLFPVATVWAIGSQTPIDGVISTAVDAAGDGPVCCFNQLGEDPLYPECDTSFAEHISDINAIVDGDTGAIDSLIPSIMNSYTGVDDMVLLKDRLESLTTDEVVRYNLYREIIERGIQIRCEVEEPNTKFLTRL